MPPSMHYQTLCALPGALSARAMASASRSSPGLAVVSMACRAPSFSTSASRARTAAPPESPLYITLPKQPQSAEGRLSRVRGHLPRPRQVFKQRGGLRKLDGDFVERALPLSRAQVTGRSPKSEVQMRKWEMTEMRRKSLAAGIQGLWERKVFFDKARRRTAVVKFQKNRRAARKPERADEALTRSTVLASTAKVTKVILDPERFEKADTARQAHSEILARKNELRQDALARLYTASTDFIVDESELEAKVNDIFDNPKYLNSALDKTESQWGFGAPVSIQQLRKMMEDTGLNSKKATLATLRQKQLSEELMGGKMD